MTLAAAGGPTWTDRWTAIGTVAAVIVALGIALYADWRAGKRLAAEHERSDRVLGEERERTATELAEQRQHERTALDDERAYSRRQLEEERQIALERDQLAQAYAVQVVLGERQVDDGSRNQFGDPARSELQQIAVMIVNRGSFTITRVEVQFYTGNSMSSPHNHARLSGFDQVPAALRGEFRLSAERAMSGVLTPFDAGMRFSTDVMHERFLVSPYPVVRWTDRWGTRWEHKKGVVRQVTDDAPWEP